MSHMMPSAAVAVHGLSFTSLALLLELVCLIEFKLVYGFTTNGAPRCSMATRQVVCNAGLSETHHSNSANGITHNFWLAFSMSL